MPFRLLVAILVLHEPELARVIFDLFTVVFEGISFLALDVGNRLARDQRGLQLAPHGRVQPEGPAIDFDQAVIPSREIGISDRTDQVLAGVEVDSAVRFVQVVGVDRLEGVNVELAGFVFGGHYNSF